MSVKTQEKRMKQLARLVAMDLAYIYGDRESGPNGAKAEYLRTGKAFLREMAKDLGFTESQAYTMPGGIGVNGEIALMGMWNGGNGVYILIHRDDFTGSILYRRVRHMKDYTGGRNRHLTRNVLLGQYGDLLERFLELKEEPAYASVA